MILSKEEIEEAKERIKYLCDKSLNNISYDHILTTLELHYLRLLLQYIEELEISNKELDKENDRLEKIELERDMSNKIIDEMAIMLEGLKLCFFKKEDGGELLGKYRHYNKEDWKQYFEEKVEGK